MPHLELYHCNVEYWPLVRFREITEHPDMLFLTPSRLAISQTAEPSARAHGGMFNLVDIPTNWPPESRKTQHLLDRFKPVIDAAFTPVLRHVETGGRVVFSRGLSALWPDTGRACAVDDALRRYINSWLARLCRVDPVADA
ncbi:hypothetical protein [Salinisphaera orenii]|uniref:hypothetical protein n=1 Tax=Salinisphaera orenii TaxID=856731 RepID=UPI0013A5FA95